MRACSFFVAILDVKHARIEMTPLETVSWRYASAVLPPELVALQPDAG